MTKDGFLTPSCDGMIGIGVDDRHFRPSRPLRGKQQGGGGLPDAPLGLMNAMVGMSKDV